MGTVAIGEVLWDIFDNARHIGGAPFNFSAHLARLGHRVWFVSAVGRDDLGRLALQRVRELGLDGRYVRITDLAPTGTVKVHLSDGQPDFSITRPAAYDFLHLTEDDFNEICASGVRWIYHGTLGQMRSEARELTRRMIAANPRARVFYDVNLRKDSFTPQLVNELMTSASVLKLNDQEMSAVLKMFGDIRMTTPKFCDVYSRKFGCDTICVTSGGNGCAVWSKGCYIEVPGYLVRVADAVGAGDAFSAALLHGFDLGWTAEDSADFASRLGALIASRPGAIPPWTMDELRGLRPASSG